MALTVVIIMIIAGHWQWALILDLRPASLISTATGGIFFLFVFLSKDNFAEQALAPSSGWDVRRFRLGRKRKTVRKIAIIVTIMAGNKTENRNQCNKTGRTSLHERSGRNWFLARADTDFTLDAHVHRVNWFFSKCHLIKWMTLQCSDRQTWRNFSFS